MKINWLANKKVNMKSVNERILQCEKLNNFTNGGQYTKSLEDFIKTKFLINHNKSVIVCNNGTSAIHALVSAIHMKNNKKLKWCTQSFTFPASAQGILDDTYIVDIDEEGGLDLNLVPNDTDGIIVTNVFGNCVNINKYINWAKNNNKYLIFDNAATAYTFYKGSNTCNYGLGATISFHHTKPFGFGEGGAIIIDKEYEIKVRRILNFGIDNNLNLSWNNYGSNYKMSEINAIYILSFLEDNFDKIVKHHKLMYKKAIKLGIKMYPNFSDDNPVLSCFCFLDNKFNKEYIKKMLEKGIYCRKYYKPLKKSYNAMKIFNKILCYPCNLDNKNIYLI